jgi:UDP-N-acetylmuramoyl-tripeptide--D-alanyl-D-alanine ligase
MADLGWTLGRIGAVAGGKVAGDAGLPVARVVIDSREDTRGALFVALEGERFDGHDFLYQAVDGGAAAVMVAGRARDVGAPQVVVDDTLLALQQLGRARRREFAGPVAAITGSSGKTTTRRMLAAITGQRFATHQPLKNFNNHVGLPLTLLGLSAAHGAAVLELGCSGFGEIALLAGLCEPNVALVTNVGPAHLEQLGDLDGVARAKGELFGELGPDAVAVVNLDDQRVAAMSTGAARRVTFGQCDGADVRLISRSADGLAGQSVEIEISGASFGARLPLLGAHNAQNALAAAAAAVAIGLGESEIVAGLADVEPIPGRLVPLAGPSGSLIIDDTYNANPASTRAALDVLIEVAPADERIAVLGDMLELGQASPAAHRAIGERIAGSGLALLVTIGAGGAAIGEGAVGASMTAEKHRHVADHAQAARIVRELAGNGVAVLVKGSRGMCMENVVHELAEGDD